MEDNVENELQSVFTGGKSGEHGMPEKRRVIDDPYIHRLQRRHFVLFGLLPFLGTLGAFVRPLGWPQAVAFVTMWVITGLGISAGYHRLFAHRSYTVTRGTRVALAIAGSMAGQGGLISWVAMHRRHHECGDRAGDMHSPNLHGPGWRGQLRGFLHAHLTWMVAHDYPNVVHYAPDLVRDADMSYVSRHYYRWAALGMVLPAVFCALVGRSWWGLLDGLLWGGFVRMFVLEHGIWSLNSLCHLFGKRLFATRDNSRNIAWLAPFIFGESWHHNHHAFPGSASFGLRWYRIDPGYWFIRTLAVLGLAKDVKVASRSQIEARTLRH
jgi:stearoyl-CoA desaturase (Delta-9 desaturase)